MSKKPIVLTRKAAIAMGALVGFLRPKLAQDAAINFYPVLGGVTAKNFKAKKAHIVKTVTEQVRGQLAEDATIDGLVELLDGLEKVETGDALETEPNAGLPMGEMEEDEDPELEEGKEKAVDADAHAGLRAFLEGKLDPADIEKACAMVGGGGDEDVGSVEKSKSGLDEDLEHEMKEKGTAKDKKKGAKDEPPPFKGKPEVGGGMSKDAVNRAIKVAQDEAIKTVQASFAAVREAERYVRPWIGDLAMAHDSAEAVYRTTLEALGVDIEGVHPSAFKALLKQVPQPGARKAPLGEDSSLSVSADLSKRFPGIERIKVMT